MDQELMLNFLEAYEFIDNHPAFVGPIFNGVSSLTTLVYACCKRGKGESDAISLYPEDKRFSEFADKEEKEYVLVSYEDYYGEEWKFDHVEVLVEGGANVFKPGSDTTDIWAWDRYHDLDLNCSGRSYEEAIINFSNKVKAIYGDYSSEIHSENSIIPEWIREHNKENPIVKDINDIFKDGRININDKYISLRDEEINAIWWDVYKKNHGGKMGQETINITRFLNKENYESHNGTINSEN